MVTFLAYNSVVSPSSGSLSEMGDKSSGNFSPDSVDLGLLSGVVGTKKNRFPWS